MGAAEVIEITGNATCIEQGASTAQENVILLNANGMIIGDALLPVPFAGNSSSEWQAKKPAGNHLFPDLWVEVLRELRQKIACAASIDTEHVMKKTIDGQSRWFHVAARSVQARDADAACHVLILRDITRQKRLEEENQVLLQQSEILKKIGRIDVLEMKEEAGDIELPESFREILQLAAEKSGLTMSEVIHLIHPDDKQGLFEHVRGCMDDNRAVDVEFRVEIPGEQARWIRCHSLPSREDAQGRLPRRWSVQDVTFYKKVNLDLLEKLKESNKHLLLANSSLSDFSYALSHDLKRPVRHMKSFAELLDEALDRGDVAAAREFSRRIGPMRCGGGSGHSLCPPAWPINPLPVSFRHDLTLEDVARPRLRLQRRRDAGRSLDPAFQTVDGGMQHVVGIAVVGDAQGFANLVVRHQFAAGAGKSFDQQRIGRTQFDRIPFRRDQEATVLVIHPGGMQVGSFVVHASLDGLNGDEHLFISNGFGQVHVGTCIEALFEIAGLRTAGQHEDSCAKPTPDQSAQGETIQPGAIEIDDVETGLERRRGGDEIIRIDEARNGDSVGLKVVGQSLQKMRVTVDNGHRLRQCSVRDGHDICASRDIC